MSMRELGQSNEDTMTPSRPVMAPWPGEQESEDKMLTLAFKRGERGAYQAIYERYSTRVHGVCRRMLLQPEDAEEAAQESFLRVYQALARFNGRYLLGPWITRITTNICLDHLRAKGRKPVDLVPVEDLELRAHCTEQDELDPERLHLRSAESRRVRHLLGSLPPMYRAAIVLRDFEGLSYAEVATVLQISETQTKALIHRARQAFKRSWSSALLTVPLRFFHRFRRVVPSGRDQSGQAAGSLQQTSEVMGSAAQVASSCSAAIQQCGHIFVERVASVTAVALIGTAAASVAIAHSPAPAPRAPIQAAAQVAVATTHVTGRRPAATVKQPRVARGVTHQPEEPLPAEPTPAPEPAAPAAVEPTPTPTDAPEDTTTNEGGGHPATDPTPTESPTPAPAEPEGFTFAFDASNAAPAAACSCASSTAVKSSAIGITSNGIEYIDQVLTSSGHPSNGSDYGVWARQSSDSGVNHRIELHLYTPEGGYFYTGSGSLVDRSLTSWGGWSYTYSGTYRSSSRPMADEAMPSHGTYSVTVQASWHSNRIVATTYSLLESNS